MGWAAGTQALRILAVSVAVLLSAGALSAAVVDSEPAPAKVGLPVQSTVLEPTTTTTTAVARPTTTPPSSTIPATTTTRRPTTATTAKAAIPSTLAPTRPRPSILTIPTTPRVPPATSWQADKNGVSARVRIEPASPSAGQPVNFVIDVSSAQLCCLIVVGFGEGSAAGSNVTEVCTGSEPLTTGSSTFETTHTYPAPGVYQAIISIDAGDSCPQTAPPGGRVGTPEVIIEACFAVGPGTAGQEGCAPRLVPR